MGLVLGCGGTARALSVIAPTFSELVQKSEQIARVEITAVNSQLDAAPTQGQVIHTYVQCRVIRMIKGDPQATLTLRFLGGEVDGLRMQIPDMPEFKVGEVCIVFLAENGRAFCPLVGVMHGRYRVVKDQKTGAEHVARNSGEALNAVDDVSQPMRESAVGSPSADGMTRDQFESAVAREIAHVRAQ